MATHTHAGRPVGGRRLYTWAAVAAAAVVFIGFARSYYLKGAFGAPALSALVHAHGLVMTLWFVLFVVQARLVAARRIDLHRRLGIAGATVAALVFVVGVSTAINAAARGVSPGPPPLVFLVVPLGDMLVFATLAGAGLLLRRRGDHHKRLMLLASVGMLTAAFARIPLDLVKAGGLPLFFALNDLLVLACVGYDTVKNRRLHPAFGWGALLIVVSQPLRLLLAGTAGWLQFASWLIR
jgi:hypothetical protein